VVTGGSVRDVQPYKWQFLDEIEQEERNIFKGQLVKYNVLEEFDEELGCYPIIAYLDSGEQARGRNRGEARDKLEQLM